MMNARTYRKGAINMSNFTGLQYTSLKREFGFKGRHTCIKEGVRLWQKTCSGIHVTRDHAIKAAQIDGLRYLVKRFLEVQP